MKKALASRLALLILAGGLIWPLAAGTSFAQEACWDNSMIQSALAEGRIQPVAAVLSREGVSPSTEVLNVKVCEQDGALVYVLATLDASGEARNRTFNAQ